MIDDSDGNDALLAAAVSGGWPAFVLIIIAVILFALSADNKADCAKKTCPTGQTPRLMDHECLCTAVAR